MKIDRILISRTDSIGDVMLTLPMAGWIKKHHSATEVIALGRDYTLPIWNACEHIDECYSWDTAKSDDERISLLSDINADWIFLAFPDAHVTRSAKAAGIPHRVASARRWHTLRAVNHPLFYSRKNSDLHESQLNLKMLKLLGLKEVPNRLEVSDLYGFHSQVSWKGNRPDEGKHTVIMHPKSKGSALEWPLDSYAQLIERLDSEKFVVQITGTADERKAMGGSLPWNAPHVEDLTGKVSLAELVSVIDQSDALVACSTGPLHMAAALGKTAIGLYTPKKPMHIGRWGPLGNNALAIEDETHPTDGQLKVSPKVVFDLLQSKMEASSK